MTDRQTDRQCRIYPSIYLSIHPSINLRGSPFVLFSLLFSSLLFSSLLFSSLTFIHSFFLSFLPSILPFYRAHLISSHLVESNRMLCMPLRTVRYEHEHEYEYRYKYSTNDEMGVKEVYHIILYYIILDWKQLPNPTNPLCHAMSFHALSRHTSSRAVLYCIVLHSS